MPGDTFAHGHGNFGAVVVPAPLRQQTRRWFQIGLLQNELIKHGLIQALNCRVHRRRANSRIPGRQTDVISDDQLVNGLRAGRQADKPQGGGCGGQL